MKTEYSNVFNRRTQKTEEMTEQEALDWAKYNLNHPESIKNIQAQFKKLAHELVAKEQECAKLKIDASHHAYNCDRAKQERDKAEAENDSLRAENERLKTTLMAGAELIKENWSKLCDDEGYGPQNLLLRMDGTLNTSGYPGYSSGEFEKLRKRCEDLEAAAKVVIQKTECCKEDLVIADIRKLLSQ